MLTPSSEYDKSLKENIGHKEAQMSELRDALNSVFGPGEIG